MSVVSIQKNLRKNRNKVIILDAGCVYRELPGYGHLAALDLDSGRLYLQENVED